MTEFEQNEDFTRFVSTLIDAGLINLDKQDRITVSNKGQFIELGFGLYLLWLHVHKRIRTPFLYFTAIDPDKTLFLVSPYQDNPFFCRPRGYRPGNFYLDTLEKCFKTNPTACQFCDLRNSLLFNISYYKYTDAFKDFLIEEEKRIKNDFPKIQDCHKCKPMYLNWLDTKIRQDDRYGLCLGGYPALLEIPSKVFELLFTAPMEEAIREETGRLFDSFLTVYFAEKFRSRKYASNTTLSSPFESTEIDSIILIQNKSRTNLLVIETTSYHHDQSGLKNKLLNYSALNQQGYDKFLYVYLTLMQAPVAIRRNKQIEPVTEKTKDLGALASIMTESNFECLHLPPTYKDLESNLKVDWWDKEYIRGSYYHIIEALEDLTGQLK